MLRLLQSATYTFALFAVFFPIASTAQISSFIVTSTNDTINVDKINRTDFEIKTKTAGKKKTFPQDAVLSYYVFEENAHYQRLTIKKREPKPVDRYDYKRNEDAPLEEYKNRIKYKYIPRLTGGKVKLFIESSVEYTSYSVPGQPGVSAPFENEVCYIAINGATLEPLNRGGKFELTKEVYDVLKLYLHGNEKITRQLDQLFSSKPVADKQQIIALAKEYNTWAASEK